MVGKLDDGILDLGFSTAFAMNHNGSSSSDGSSPGRSQPAARTPAHHENGEEDELDFFVGDEPSRYDDILDDQDPLSSDLAEPVSFKRKQKQSVLSNPARFFTSFTGHRNNGTSPARPQQPPTRLEGVRAEARSANNLNVGTKDGAPLDWYVEGPGRRVGYEDLTAIDWIFEYTKERQRLRVLYSSATGLLGYAQQFLDASQIWVILVLTGLAVGAVAACIDLTTDWLGDLKYGYCSSIEGGAFYLSKGFCCLGYDEHAKCMGWRSWSAALGIFSAGGKWFIGYFFFLLISVCSHLLPSLFVVDDFYGLLTGFSPLS